MTPSGLSALQKEQEELLQKRPGAVLELKRAREMGDLSENGAYKSAKWLVSQIDSRLRHLNNLIRFAQVVEVVKKDIVSLGGSVVVRDQKNEQTFSLVGEQEADPRLGKISHTSPIGRALMGKKAGDSVRVVIPSGEIVYTIVRIV